jgi:hypothetical protein
LQISPFVLFAGGTDASLAQRNAKEELCPSLSCPFVVCVDCLCMA